MVKIREGEQNLAKQPFKAGLGLSPLGQGPPPNLLPEPLHDLRVIVNSPKKDSGGLTFRKDLLLNGKGAVLGSTKALLPKEGREGQERVVVFVVQLQWTEGLWDIKKLVCQAESGLKVSWS